jgi:hypothetical protein
MATRKPRIENGVGLMAPSPVLKLEEDGSLSSIMLSLLNRFLQEIVRKINTLSLGDGSQGSRSGNLDGQYRDWISPSAANTQFSVPHGLDRVPVGYFVVRQDRAGDVYTSNEAGWGPSQIFLKTSVGSMEIRLLLF